MNDHGGSPASHQGDELPPSAGTPLLKPAATPSIDGTCSGSARVLAHVRKAIPYFRDPRNVLVCKLDTILLAWTFVAGILKEMDQTATTQAYVSGMRESLGLHGNELVVFNTFFSVGYAAGLVPGQLIQTRVRPSHFLPACEIIWGLLVLFTYKAPDAQTIYVLRLFLGLLSAAFWPSVVSLLFNWYTPAELAVRVAIFTVSDVAGAMFLGALQAALYHSMDGLHGLRGWQWLFVVAGCMTVAQGLAALVIVPDSPATTRAAWLSRDEKRLARSRMDAFGAKTSRPVDGATLRRKMGAMLRSPVTWYFLAAFALNAWAHRANAYFVLYLESVVDADGRRVYGVWEVNVLPLGGYALQILTTVGFNALSDRMRWRWQVGVASALFHGLFLSILCAWPADRGIVMAFYFLTYATNAGSSSLMAWLAELLRKEPEARAIVVAVTVTVVYVGHATIPLWAFRVRDAPEYPVGFPLTTAMSFCAVGVQLALLAWEKRHPELAERGFGGWETRGREARDEEVTRLLGDGDEAACEVRGR